MLAARSTDALDRVVTEIGAADGTAGAVTVDLANRDSIRAAVKWVEELHGRLDGAFNNGGIMQLQAGPLDTTSDADVEQQFSVNFWAHWTAMNAEVALLRGSGGGAIVNTSSIGSRRANPFLPAYGAMKRALNSITETAAVSWAPEGIRVNGITPGGTATEMVQAWDEATPGIGPAGCSVGARMFPTSDGSAAPILDSRPCRGGDSALHSGRSGPGPGPTWLDSPGRAVASLDFSCTVRG